MWPRNATDQLIQTNVPLQLQFVIFKAQLRWRFLGPLDASFTQYCPILLSDHFSTVDSGMNKLLLLLFEPSESPD